MTHDLRFSILALPLILVGCIEVSSSPTPSGNGDAWIRAGSAMMSCSSYGLANAMGAAGSGQYCPPPQLSRPPTQTGLENCRVNPNRNAHYQLICDDGRQCRVLSNGTFECS